MKADFRAYQKEINKMYDFPEVLCHYGPTALFIEPDKFGLTVMFWTNLYDKNGAKIYEGDVCLFHYVLTGITKKGVITFVNGCFVHEDFKHNTVEIHSQSIEKIGNIYENPELVEEK